MSYKGPRELRSKVREARKLHKGKLAWIDTSKKSRLEDLLRKHIQKNIIFQEESNERMQEYYQHYFDHLIWQLRRRTSNSFILPHLVEYLRFVGEKEKDGSYFKEPLLCLMAITLYNLEMKPSKDVIYTTIKGKL